MKPLRKFFLSLLLFLLLVLLLSYILLQTRWGADRVSRWVTEDTAYHFSVTKIEHNFSDPALLILHNVSFGHDGQPAVLVAKRVDLGLRLAQFSQPLHFNSIDLHDGTLDVTNVPDDMAWQLQADRLQLSNMAVNSMSSALPLRAQQVNGGILPWQPQAGNISGNNAQFQMSADSLLLNNLPVTNLLVQGELHNRQLTFSNFGADLARGSVTARAQRDAQGNWEVSTLRLSNIRLQTDRTLEDFLQPIRQLPPVHFTRTDITDARLQGPDWAATDLDLVVKELSLRDGVWQSEGGSLALNADSLIYDQLMLNDPILTLDLTPQGIDDVRFSSRWANGLVRAQGSWSRQTQRLTLDDLVLAGLEYTLPTNWRARWMQTLPAWLDSVLVKKLDANHNLLIDVNPHFPFQLTALDGTGSDLLLARDRQWGIWSGELRLNAAEATFNRNDIRHPSLSLTADAEQIRVTEMSAFVGEGLLEGLAQVDQNPSRNLTLSLSGRALPVNTLENWGWPHLSLEGAASSLQLKLNASLAADAPLKNSASGTLSISSDSGSLQQTMQHGVVSEN